MSIFADVKSQIHLPNAAEYYGIQVNRGGFASCLFHEERTPSMKLYDNHFHCYGCGERGDIITLTEKIFSISPYAAAQKLSQDFHINYKKNYTPISEPTLTQKSYHEQEKRAFNMLNQYCCFLEECREKYKPKNLDDELHPLFVESLHNYEKYNYYCDIFIFGSTEERIQFINDFREGIYDIERRFAAIVV